MTSFLISYEINNNNIQTYQDLLVSWRIKIEDIDTSGNYSSIKVQKDVVDKLIRNTLNEDGTLKEKVIERGLTLIVTRSLCKMLEEETDEANIDNLESQDLELKNIILISNIIKRAISNAISPDIEKPII